MRQLQDAELEEKNATFDKGSFAADEFLQLKLTSGIPQIVLDMEFTWAMQNHPDIVQMKRETCAIPLDASCIQCRRKRNQLYDQQDCLRSVAQFQAKHLFLL